MDIEEVKASAANVFGLWDQTTDSVVKLLTHVAQQPDFPESMNRFALYVEELVDWQRALIHQHPEQTAELL